MSASMTAMGGMSMPGGWTLSMAWMRMPGQSWAGAAASFLAMWIVMMAAMMLPSLLPTLWRHYELARRAGIVRPARLTAFAGAGYFFVWTLFGAAAFALGASLAALAIRCPAAARIVPAAMGVIVLLAGTLQLTSWKARRLACCRQAPGPSARTTGSTAWRYGLRLGLNCCCCCAGPTAVLLAIGVMDLRAMGVVTAAITAERLAPAGAAVARIVGVAMLAAGVLLIAQNGALGYLAPL